MATQALSTSDRKELSAATPAVVEQVIVKGNLAELTVEGRIAYYNLVCQSTGLNPLTRPFEFITLNSKLVLYAKRDATDQLRKIHGVSIPSLKSEQIGDLLIVTVQAIDRTGRSDTATGAVNLKGKVGDDLANAMMKAETKAKRRVTLSLCGLGMLDETEVADADTEDDDPRPAIQQPVRASAPPTPAALPAHIAAPVPTNGNGHSDVISGEQRREFIKIAMDEGWSQQQIKQLLLEHWGFDGTAKITVDKFAEVCKSFGSQPFQRPGPYQPSDEDIPF